MLFLKILIVSLLPFVQQIHFVSLYLLSFRRRNLSASGSGRHKQVSLSSMDAITYVVGELECFLLYSPEPRLEKFRVPPIVDKRKVSEVLSWLEAADVLQIAKTYLIPPKNLLIVPRIEDRACSPPEGFVIVYEESLRHGLRFPVCQAYADLLQELGIVLGQVTPNSFAQLLGFGIAVSHRGHALSPNLISRFYQFKTNRSPGWFSLTARRGFKINTPNKIHDWESRYFFVESDLGRIR